MPKKAKELTGLAVAKLKKKALLPSGALTACIFETEVSRVHGCFALLWG